MDLLNSEIQYGNLATFVLKLCQSKNEMKKKKFAFDLKFYIVNCEIHHIVAFVNAIAHFHKYQMERYFLLMMGFSCAVFHRICFFYLLLECDQLKIYFNDSLYMTRIWSHFRFSSLRYIITQPDCCFFFIESIPSSMVPWATANMLKKKMPEKFVICIQIVTKGTPLMCIGSAILSDNEEIFIDWEREKKCRHRKKICCPIFIGLVFKRHSHTVCVPFYIISWNMNTARK